MTRRSVLVDFPFDLPRVAAEMQMDARAKRAFVEEAIREKLSPDLMLYRETEVRNAIEPPDAYAVDFKIVSRTLEGRRMRVVCEADVDLGAVLFTLVQNRILTFGAQPPRLLLLPGPATSMEGVANIRARLRPTLGGAGMELLAAEDVANGYSPRSPSGPQGAEGIARQVSGARADLLAVVTLRAQEVPSAVGGVVLDANLQFAVVRPGDNKLVAEATFTARGSGATKLLAEQAVYQELGPEMARILGSQLSSAIFANQEVKDPASVGRVTNVDVFFSPSPAATSALMDFFKQRNLKVALGAGGTRSTSAHVGDAAFLSQNRAKEQLVVEGSAGVADIYGWLATARFGASQTYSASIVAHDDGYIAIEIVAPNAAPRAPAVKKAPEASAPEAGPANLGGPRPPLQLRRKIR